MPGRQHDDACHFIRNEPEVVLWALRNVAGLDLPDPVIPLHLDSGELNTRVSRDLQIDNLLVDGPSHDPHRLMVAEVETKLTEEKLRQCVRYAMGLCFQHNVDVHVVMFTPDPEADKFSGPVVVKRGGLTATLDLCIAGPGQIPVFTTAEEFLADLAVGGMSVMAHGDRIEVRRAFLECVVKLTAIDPGHATCYFENTVGVATDSGRRALEAMAATSEWPVISKIGKEHFSRGKAEGEAEVLLVVLEARGIPVSAEVRERIEGCADSDQLLAWAVRAAQVNDASELFD